MPSPVRSGITILSIEVQPGGMWRRHAPRSIVSTTSSPTTTIPSGALAAIEAMTAEIENNLTPGGLAFNHPDRMAFGETLTIRLKVEPGARGVEIAPTNDEAGNVVPADIEVAALMPAILVGLGFDIVPLTPPIQPLPGNAEWKWQITAED